MTSGLYMRSRQKRAQGQNEPKKIEPEGKHEPNKMTPIKKTLRIYPTVISNITISFCQVIKKASSSTWIK